MALETLSTFSHAPYAAGFFFVALSYFIIYPLVVYFKDSKGKPHGPGHRMNSH